MRHVAPITIAILALAAASACAPRVDLAAEEAAVRARSEALSALEAERNVDQAITFWTDDAFAQPSGGPAMVGKEALLPLYRQFFGDSNFKAFSSTSTSIVVAASGDLAYHFGVNRMTIATPGGEIVDVGKYLAVWRKVSGEWMVAGLAFSSDAPPPAMPAAPAAKMPMKK